MTAESEETMSHVTDHLKAVPLFQGLSDSALDAVAGLATEVEFTDGQTVTREGELGDSFYVLVAGQLNVSRNDSDVRVLGPGDFLGEISLVDGRPRTATTTAVGPVETLVIHRPAFLELMDSFGPVRLGVLMALTDRIRSDERASVD
jgi:CRP/FNR family transcriptional regulator, cyclic AMP receptor protein